MRRVGHLARQSMSGQVAAPSVVDYGYFLSARARSMPPNPFERLKPLMGDPAVKVLCQGVPPDTTFPLQRISVTLSDGTEVNLSPEDTKLSQRYAPFAWGPLREWINQHVDKLHAPPFSDWDVAVAAGSMSSVDLVFAALLDRGDVVLIEEFSFLAALDALKSYGAELIPVALDADGLVPESLVTACEKLAQEGRRAKMLYTVPVGQNPTGTSLPRKRYQAIYEIARRFDLLIVEDDAYFYEQHSLREAASGESSETLPGLRLGTSFLSLDIDGRVLRLDSFSKFLAPGFRLAWVTGPKYLIDTYNGLAYASSANGCSLSMMLLGRALEAWGDTGLEAHLFKLQSTLRDRCRALASAVTQHLGESAAIVRHPQAGMFLWVRLANQSITTDHLLDQLQKHGVAVMPGSFCAVAPCTNGGENVACQYVRLTYVLGEEHYSEAMSRFAAVLSNAA